MTEARHGQRHELRASAADRDRTAARLGRALAVGRPTCTRTRGRLDAAYAARTVGELVSRTPDLPDDDVTETGLETADRGTSGLRRALIRASIGTGAPCSALPAAYQPGRMPYGNIAMIASMWRITPPEILNSSQMK